MYRIIAISAACTVSALGQTTANPDAVFQKQVVVQVGDVAQFGPVPITAAMAGPMATVAGAPYSAQTSTQRVQILADGNRIEQTASGSVARDSQGRVRRDEALPGLTLGDGDAPHLVLIEDPVAGAHWTLDERAKIAIKMPFLQMRAGAFSASVPAPGGPDKTFFFSGGPAGVATAGPVSMKPQGVPDSNTSKTDLGTQTLEGVPAQGTRITRTIPAGSIGNEQPIVITTETWYSPDLKVLVMSKTDDPRMGETTYKLINIQRSEPAASLFQVPDDYTVKDRPANDFVYHETKKTP